MRLNTKNNKISFKIKDAEEKLPPDSSKFFGDPYIWKGFEWPEYLDDDGEWYCMDFICQINCAELSAFDDGTLQSYIHPEKLMAGDTSDVAVRLNTT